MPRYKQLNVKKMSLVELAPQRRERKPSPRQLAALEREREIKAALNEAASLPPSEAIVIELKEGQKMPTLRAAIVRVLKAEPRSLNWGIRGGRVVISRGAIPGGRGGRRKSSGAG